MSLIAEYLLSNPILRETRERLPELLVQIEDEYFVSGSDGVTAEIVILFVGDGDELAELEAALAADPSLADYQILADFGASELIRITLSEEGIRGMTYPIAVSEGITFLDLTARGTDLRYRVQVPTRDALSNYREQCAERNLSFQLLNLYRSQSFAKKEYGLSTRQREVLLHALEAGYFEVPRRTTLAELAAELEISDQALSALLRRGQTQLLRHTIGSEVSRDE